jgi:hypothetical protein
MEFSQPGNIPIEHRLVREVLPEWKDFTVVCQKWLSCSKFPYTIYIIVNIVFLKNYQPYVKVAVISSTDFLGLGS